MTKDEALKMAIDFAQRGGSISVPQYYIERDKLINACKEALKPHPDCDEACMFQCQMEKKFAQEPIFWMHEVEEAPFEGHQVTVAPEQDDYYTIPIYAHPAPQLAQNEEDDMAFWERLESEVNENGY